MKKIEFNRTFSPENLITFCANHTKDEMLTADVPTLKDCNNAYGADTAEALLRTHLFRLCEYLQLGMKPTGALLTDIALLIYCDYSDLTPYQLMLFFKELRTGDFAARDRQCEIKVSLSGPAVMLALKLFRKDIREAFDRKERDFKVVRPFTPYDSLKLYLYTKTLVPTDPEAAAILMPPEERPEQYREETDLQFYARHVAGYVRFVHSTECSLAELELRAKFYGTVKANRSLCRTENDRRTAASSIAAAG